MADHSAPARFQNLFEAALQIYEKRTSITWSDYPLAERLQRCLTVEEMTTLLRGQAQVFSDFREGDRLLKTIETTVSILSPLSFAASLADDVSLTLLPQARAIHATLGILLDAANGVITSYDALTDMLESIEYFVKRLKIYTETSQPMPSVDEIVINMMVELISMLVLVAQKLRKRRSLKWVKNFFGLKDIRATRKRLDRLMQEEDRMVAAQTLGLVDGDKASTDGVRKVLDQMTSDADKLKRDELLRNFQRWLSPPDPWKNYNVARKSRHSETGAWFVKSNALSEWKVSGPSSLLWINGKPGAGKSVLCSVVIDEIETMRESGDALLAMYYYDFREDQKKDLRGLLSSMLYQLFDQSDSFYSIFSTFYSKYHRGVQKCPSDDDLFRCLMDLLKCPRSPPVYLIIDGLDECPSTSTQSSPREQVLSFLEDLVEVQLPNLRICVTSRPEVDIKVILEPLTFRSISLHDESGQKEDIKKYIKSFVDTNRKMKSWDPEYKHLVIDVLTEKADGMFRWVDCQLAYLTDCFPGNVRDVLDGLPATLDETYERTLREIKETKWEFARRLLQCVAVAFRPLQVEELAEILALDFKAGTIPKFRKDWRLNNPVEAVLSTCSTLLSLVDVGNSRVIQFAHFSVKEYLTSTRFAIKNDPISHRYHISMTPAHTIVAQACLGILLHLDNNVTRSSLTQFPLAEYAAKHWFEHARFEGVSQTTEEGMKQLFDPGKPHLSIWLWIWDPIWTRHEQTERPSPPRGTPLHYAAFCGLHDIVKALAIERAKDLNSCSFEDKSTPLHLSSREGHTEVARFLVEHNADAAARDNDGWTPLHLASYRGHLELTQMLVGRDADVAAQGNDRRTPLHLASEWGHVNIARMLVDHGADVIAQANDGKTPLHWASLNGHTDPARMLVEHGASTAVLDNDGWTPLHLASYRGHLDVVRMLVVHADAAARGGDGRTPLHLASEWGHVNIARMLVEHGANATAQANDRRTPLHWASLNGHVGPAQMLVEHGVDMAVLDNDGWTPLHLASYKGHLDLVRILVAHGADAAAQGGDGRTPLHLASEWDHVNIARMLVEHGATTTAQANDRRTPLHWASLNGHVEPAQMLVEHGADTAVLDNDGWTPLHLASYKGHVELSRMLVGHGANAEARGSDGRTPLHLASEWGHVDIAWMLVEHGADVAAQANDRRTPLHWASLNGHVGPAQMLVEHGADLVVLDNDGWTPLHLASYRGYLYLVRMLVGHGANAAAQGGDGRTPLHLASEWGHVDIARILVKHGADATAQANDRRTPLHWASLNGRVGPARMLVEHGANTTVLDNDGWTPLHLASYRGHLDLVRILVVHADAAARGGDGRTPLHLASEWGHVDIARILVKHGADPTAYANDKRTPLHWASLNGHVGPARMLIEHGANTTVLDNDGWTPLHLASYRGHLDLVRMLVGHGVDVATQGGDGRTPLHLASEWGHVDLARMLVGHGADAAAKANDGRTPLHWALLNGHADLARMLVGHGADAAA